MARRFARVLLLGWLVVAAAGAEAANRAPFSLIDHDGRAVTDADFRGRYLLLFFGYTACPDICPTDLAVIAATLDRLGEAAAAVQPLFVTIDPERDTPSVLAAYVANFHPRLIGLTGTPEAVAAIAARYGVGVQRSGAAAGGDYLLDHTGATYLIGPDGGGLRRFRHGTGAAEMAAVIGALIASGGTD